MTRFSILAVLLALLPVEGVSGQSIPSPYRFVENGQEAGAFVGWFDGGTDRFGLGPRSAPLYGVRYAVTVTDALALEGLASVSPTPRDVVNPNRVEGDRVIDQAETLLSLLEARFRFNLTGQRTWNGIQPFGLLGVGLAWDAQGDQAEDARLNQEDRFSLGTRLTGSFGGGVRWILSDKLHLRLDGTALLYQVKIPEGFRDLGVEGEAIPEDEWITSRALTLGVAWRF